MESIEGLNELIKKRLIENKGSIKLTENIDIILYGKAIGISENQLLFKILEIEETIDWEAEKLKEQESVEKPTCPKCNSVFSSDIKFCINDGVKLVYPNKLIPKCVICKKTYTNGAKFCSNDGGAIKLDDDVLYQIEANEPSIENTNASFQENSTNGTTSQQPIYNFPKRYNKAPIGKRFLAYLLDAIITLALFLPSFYFLFNIYYGLLTDNYYYEGYDSNSNVKLFVGIALLILPLIYSLIKDGIGEGQSFGKRAVGLMVINVNTNAPCTKLNSVGRNILFSMISNIPFIGLLLEIIMIFANTEGRKLSDLGAGTQVIDVNEYKNS